MFDSSFEQRCGDAINALVEGAKRVAGKDFVCSALQHRVRLKESPAEDGKLGQIDYYLGIDTLHNLTNLFAHIESAKSKLLPKRSHIVVMLKLFSYVQSVENRYTYKALGNLLRVIQNKPPDGELYDSFNSGAQCFNAVSALAERVSEAKTGSK